MIISGPRAEGPPRCDQFTWWSGVTVSTLFSAVLGGPPADGADAVADVLDLGAVQIISVPRPAAAGARTPKPIRRQDPGYLQLSLTPRAAAGAAGTRDGTAPGVGDLALYDASCPFDGWTCHEDDGGRRIVAQFPKHLVPVRPDLLRRLLGTRIPGDEGFGELLAHFLVQVTGRAGDYRAADAARLSAILLDLFAATVAQHLKDPGAASPESREHALFLRVQDFIRRNLGDPSLGPGPVAAAHHISVRSLHRLFQRQGTTVAAHIRGRRLEQARRDLADPALASRPVYAIAARWGFTRPADFTRAFRAAYGIPPRDYRDAALRRSPDTPRD